MPRAAWNGHLRLSLVSCPVYLPPATTETKRIRLNQINAETGNRLKQQLVDSETGRVVERQQVAKGYEHDRYQYVLISDEKLKALQVESSKVIELTRFVDLTPPADQRSSNTMAVVCIIKNSAVQG